MSHAEPVAKKQKFACSGSSQMQSQEANLEIEIGGDGKGGGNETVTRFYNAAVLANKSKYIDTMLASPMKESESYKLRFTDTPVETFDHALTFVLSSAQARKMTVEDVVAVAKFYDQYDFADGRDLCDLVLLEYFESLLSQEKDFSLDVDLMVEAVAVSCQANLSLAYEKGGEYIKQKMCGSASRPFSEIMFDPKHINVLVPVLVDLVEKGNTFLRWVSDTVDKQTIENPLFPALFIAQAALMNAFTSLIQPGSKVHVSGSGIAGVDGDFAEVSGSVCFSRNCSLTIDGTRYQKVSVLPMLNPRGWYVTAENDNQHQQVTLWKAKYSASLALPPMQNWEAVHQLAEGSSLEVEFEDGG